MKKKLLVLGMIASLFCLTACGNTAAVDTSADEAQAINVAETYISQIAQIEAQGLVDQLVANDPSTASIFESWEKGMADLGSYAETTGYDVKLDGKENVVNVAITGTNLDPKGQVRTANVELIYSTEDFSIVSMSVNVNYTFGELMEKAGLNTLIGMGTVFVILILISLIISLFGFIPKIQAAFAKKETKATETETSVDNTIAQIIENEELADDSELVAVISAAIAAYEEQSGSVSSDGFVVRSIRKVNAKKWQNA